MTAIISQPEPTRPLATSSADLGQCLVLEDISWQQYVTISDALPERGGLRITFDRGRLEFKTTSLVHEKIGRWLARFLDILAEEAELPTMGTGHMTFRREDLDRGMEPDDCFWIAHEELMRVVDQWLPERDPPPDLVLEIEVSRKNIDRLPILAALGVREVWCFDGATIRIYVLGPNGPYQVVERSPTFPKVDLNGLVPFFRRTETEDSLTVIRAVRAWVRELLNAA
ncbi:MAG: Uma2 family endonuclease [Planctomycetia bacterium]|nr:Uma2 family endonuclease [Planctomycetia bacterium]